MKNFLDKIYVKIILYLALIACIIVFGRNFGYMSYFAIVTVICYATAYDFMYDSNKLNVKEILDGIGFTFGFLPAVFQMVISDFLNADVLFLSVCVVAFAFYMNSKIFKKRWLYCLFSLIPFIVYGIMWLGKIIGLWGISGDASTAFAFIVGLLLVSAMLVLRIYKGSAFKKAKIWETKNIE